MTGPCPRRCGQNKKTTKAGFLTSSTECSLPDAVQGDSGSGGTPNRCRRSRKKDVTVAGTAPDSHRIPSHDTAGSRIITKVAANVALKFYNSKRKALFFAMPHKAEKSAAPATPHNDGTDAAPQGTAACNCSHGAESRHPERHTDIEQKAVYYCYRDDLLTAIACYDWQTHIHRIHTGSTDGRKRPELL